MPKPRRPGKPDRKPDKPAKVDEPDDDLPSLEELADELEELPDYADADGDTAVEVDASAAAEAGFDTVFALTVPEMEKQAMPAAVEAPLRRSVAAAAAKVRHHRVLVTFLGRTLVGSAVKQVCAKVLQQAKARKVVVRRGYGDELVHESEPPRVQVQRTVEGDVVHVEVDTGELEAADLPMALQPELVALVSGAKGQRFLFTFTGNARADGAMRQLLARTLGDAGALRAAVGQRVLFDRDLERRVQIVANGQQVAIELTPADADAETQDALAMVLGDTGGRLEGKDVLLRSPRELPPGVVGPCLEYCRKAGAQRFGVTVAGGAVDLIWPALLQASSRDDETTLRVTAGGRDRAALVAAFRRECSDLTGQLRGKAVGIQWEAGTELDAELEQQCLQLGVGRLGPTALWCTIGDGEREIYLPTPVQSSESGGLRVVRIDTEAGKPAEVLRAFERWMPRHRDELRGKAVRVAFVGAAAPSRTMVRSVLDAIAQAGAVRLETDDHGAIDVVVPALLAISGSAADGVRVAAAAAGRDREQVERALQRELDAAAPWRDATVTLVPSALTDRLQAVAIDRGAARVVLGGPTPVQVHPPVLTAERAGGEVTLRATPTADTAMVRRQIERELPDLVGDRGDLAGTAVTVVWPDAPAPEVEPLASLLTALVAGAPDRVLLDRGDGRARQVYPEVVREHVTVLGRKDDAMPPLLMLGIGIGDEPEHTAAVLQRLQPHLEPMAGRRVLLVPRSDGRDVPVPGDDPTFTAVRAAVDAAAAATIVYRGLDRRGRSFFAVAHSTIEGLPTGATLADPRPRS